MKPRHAWCHAGRLTSLRARHPHGFRRFDRGARSFVRTVVCRLRDEHRSARRGGPRPRIHVASVDAPRAIGEDTCRPCPPYVATHVASRSRDLPLGILSGGEGNDRVRISLSSRSSASLSIRSFEGLERGAFCTARFDCVVGRCWLPPGEVLSQPVVSRLFAVMVGCSTNTFSELTNPIQSPEATQIVGG